MKRIINLFWKKRTDIFVLIGVYCCMLYAFYALKLFPSHDAYNGYIATFYPFINNLLNGKIMLWDPQAACGWPFFLVFSVSGLLDPLFALATVLGKIFSLNVLQTYWIWIALRNIPILVGTYWLMKQYCRDSFCVLLATLFFFFTISFCLLRDHILFIVYWPFLLVAVTSFYRSLLRFDPSIPSFFATVILLGLSFQIYNPAYTLILLSVIAISFCLIAPRLVIPFCKSLRLVKLRYWIAAALILAVLLSPSVVILKNYNSNGYFAYIRTHQAVGRPVSHFLNSALDYFEVNPEGSPTRSLWELTSCVFPFYYAGPERMEGSVYFGFLGLIGVITGIIFLRDRAFLIYLLSSFFIAFLMSPIADGFLRFTAPLLPFLKTLNQRHLLYPAFLICVTVAGCRGLALLIDYQTMRSIAPRLTVWRVLFLGIFVLVICFLFLGLTQIPNAPYNWASMLRLQVMFLLALVLIALFLNASSRNQKWYYPYLLLLSAVFFMDLGSYCLDLVKYYHRNQGIFAKSQILRRSFKMQYKPYRSPLLPVMYGTDVYSVVHLLDLRTALPAYWHCDIIFTSGRYYRLFSFLSVDKLKHVLGINAPIIRTFTKSVMVSKDEDALIKMQTMSDSDLRDAVVLEEPNRTAVAYSAAEHIIATERQAPRRLFWGLTPGEVEASFHMQLYDKMAVIPVEKWEEVPQGVYHWPIVRVPFDLALPTDSAGEIDISRCFFPDFPYLADVDGKKYYLDKSFYLTGNPSSRQDSSFVMMQPINGKGIILECHGHKLTLPRKVYYQEERLPLPEQLSVTHMDMNRIEIFTEQKEESVLYYGDLYDSNWKASIDGRPTKIFIANYAFKAIQLPRGTHRIVFEYCVPYLGVTLFLYYGCIVFFIIIGLCNMGLLRNSQAKS